MILYLRTANHISLTTVLIELSHTVCFTAMCWAIHGGSEFGVGTILSLRNLRQGMELNAFGGVVITAANRTDITEVGHLKVMCIRPFLH